MLRLRFEEAQAVWSGNILPGLKVEIRGGWELFGLHLKWVDGKVWEEMICYSYWDQRHAAES